MENTPSNKRVTFTAEFDYAAQGPDELSLRAGDVVHSVERLAGGWCRGELHGRRGMFPDNLISAHSNNSDGPSGRCRVAFSYEPANPDELALTVGDTLEVLCEVEEGWWQGRTRHGRVGVFPSNFVVMETREEAPRLPPKPVKEQCRVLYPYTAVNDDELSLQEGDVVTLVSREGPDRGWWKGELRGKQGFFPDNFVTVIPAAAEVEEKKPDRPPLSKNIYPVLNKYSEKTASVKELTTSKTSLHKEITIGRETTVHKDEKITHGSYTEQERSVETSRGSLDEAKILDTPDGVKKPPVATKKSPTPPSSVGGLFSGLKNKILSSTEKEKPPTLSSSTSGSSGEWDRADGAAASKGPPPSAAATAPAASADNFDQVSRNSILNDPRAARVKAPRRRPPSQALRDDTPQLLGLSNGQHDVATEKTEKSDPVKPKAWEKHRAPWMDELKLNQAKKTSEPARAGGGPGAGGALGARAGSTDRLEGLGEEERSGVDMSKSMSSISGRLSLVETYEETKSQHTRHSLDSNKKEAPPAASVAPSIPSTPAPALSPTAVGRTIVTMIEEVRKPTAPMPPVAGVRTSADLSHTHHERPPSSAEQAVNERVITVERSSVKEVSDQTLIAQLNDRITNLERLVEAQNLRFCSAIEDLSHRLSAETRARTALQSELDKLAGCVTQGQKLNGETSNASQVSTTKP